MSRTNYYRKQKKNIKNSKEKAMKKEQFDALRLENAILRSLYPTTNFYKK